MNLNYISNSLKTLESDATIQNLISQANARYILYKTNEARERFPQYTIKDDQLNLLAFKYLNIGCNFFENNDYTNGAYSIEKGASILEHIHDSPDTEIMPKTKNLFLIISAMGYYASFQYSKSFILINKIRGSTIIASLIANFLNRHFDKLLSDINKIVFDLNYSDKRLAEDCDKQDNTTKIYEIIIAKVLNNYLEFHYSGDNRFLDIAQNNLIEIQKIASIRREPDIWWIIRLLLLILKGFSKSSLWLALGKYFDTKRGLPLKYIQSLVYKPKENITELFVTQRNSLPIVLNKRLRGSIISIPTSSGKTRIGEIAILNCIINDTNAKVLYIAPYRSLAYEIETSFEEVFSNLGISTSHLYGGSLFSKLEEEVINKSSVIIATPEKAKALFRSNTNVLASIKLVVIDEGHLFGANKRLTINEIFYEELRYHITINNGKFLLLSAVLPNTEELAKWLTSSSANVYKENWRPSDERIGIMEWNGSTVDLKWVSKDIKHDSFNNRFIVQEAIPSRRGARTHYFPKNKNQAIAATAYKLRFFGPVLIFVGMKRSVFTIAKEYDKCIKDNEDPFTIENKSNWRAFELACTEYYGANSQWIIFARKGIFCHNADLLSDVRLPLERLMHSEKPKVIIATSTLGQGVNLGVSTVIFSTLHQGKKLLTKRDFWNIAGRAGRAFVDNEGKILVALDTQGNKTNLPKERNLIREYFTKNNLDRAESGCLELIKILKSTAISNNIPFDKLIELIAENKIPSLDELKQLDNDLDWIDDGLLSLHNLNNPEGNDIAWVEDFFSKSLAYIQAEGNDNVSGEEVIKFMKARVKGITKRVGTRKEDWEKVISSATPINTFIQIEDVLDNIITFINCYLLNDNTLTNRILLLSNIENSINYINALSEDYRQSNDINDIRKMWLSGIPISEFSHLDQAINIITKHYSYNLPWVLNGISKILLLKGLIKESEVVEELAILVELGLPDLKSVKIYQVGIRSRASAVEIASLLPEDLIGMSIKEYKQHFIINAKQYKEIVSTTAASWIDLLVDFSKKDIVKINRIPPFNFSDVHKQTKRLIAKNIDGKQFLCSPEFDVIKLIKNKAKFDFSIISNLNGIYFDYNNNSKKWEMTCLNPYVRINKK